VALASVLAGSTSLASDDSIVTAVYSSVHNGYHREKQPDGTYKREYYALAQGQYHPAGGKDDSIDKVPFPPLAGLMAQYLANKNYYLAPDAKSAELLLVLSWGTTAPLDDGTYRMGLTNMLDSLNARNAAEGAYRNSIADGTGGRGADGIQSPEATVRDAARDDFEGQIYQMQLFEGMRRKANEENARILGYAAEVNYTDTPARFGGAGAAYNDLISDLEDERYYVVISAYDFKTAKETGKRKLLWATRVSIRAQGNRFDQSVSYMMSKASRYFGQNTGRLIRQYNEGVVNIGEMKVKGYDEPIAPTKSDEKK
jgi:hypothetical protein